VLSECISIEEAAVWMRAELEKIEAKLDMFLQSAVSRPVLVTHKSLESQNKFGPWIKEYVESLKERPEIQQDGVVGLKIYRSDLQEELVIWFWHNGNARLYELGSRETNYEDILPNTDKDKFIASLGDAFENTDEFFHGP
jgi:hypothetical protein